MHPKQTANAAYVAGAFDTSGYIYIRKRGKSNEYKVSITDQNLDVIEYIQGEYGGRIVQPKGSKSIVLEWYDRTEIRELFQSWIPYIVGKKEQMEAIITQIQNEER